MYERFEKLLSKRGITAYRVAKETGVTTATLTSWKQGKYIPKAEKLQKIADYFGVTVEYLMGNESSISTTIDFDNDDEAMEYLNIMSSLETMNLDGLKAASRYVAYLSTLDEYTCENDEQELNAAHERTDIEVDEESKIHDDDIMYNEDEWK